MRNLDTAQVAGDFVLTQFEQTADLIRNIAKAEALVMQEGISDGLKEMLQREAQAAYERLAVIRELTDKELSRMLAKSPTEQPGGDPGGIPADPWDVIDFARFPSELWARVL